MKNQESDNQTYILVLVFSFIFFLLGTILFFFIYIGDLKPTQKNQKNIRNTKTEKIKNSEEAIDKDKIKDVVKISDDPLDENYSESPSSSSIPSESPDSFDAKNEKCIIATNDLTNAVNRHLIGNKLEASLVEIVSKIDEDSCINCNLNEKKFILQIKMMAAIRDGNMEMVNKIMKKMGK